MCDGQWTTAAATEIVRVGFLVTFSTTRLFECCKNEQTSTKASTTGEEPQDQKHISSYLTMLYLLHCPNNTLRYCLRDITMLCKQFAFSSLFFRNHNPNLRSFSCYWSKSGFKNSSVVPYVGSPSIIFDCGSQQRSGTPSGFQLHFCRDKGDISAANKYVTSYSITTF